MQLPTVPFRVSVDAAAGLIVAAAMGSSAIVFSEPALADAAMMAAVIGVPVLGAAKFGKFALLNLVLWLTIVALGLAAACMATTLDTAITHQLITLFLACGGFVIAGYISADPEPRFRLVMAFYVIGCLIATAAAFAGYFKLFPSAYDLFTEYGRARGTFKDPNVLGAALASGIVVATWSLLRDRTRRAFLAASVTLVLALGLLISFSRGAWFSTLVSVGVLAWVALVRSRRQSDVVRFGLVSLLGTAGIIAVLSITLQLESVQPLLEERASLDQSYDSGPEGRFGGHAKAVALIVEHPLGIGTHTFRNTYHHEEPHNVYLSMFLNAGWLGGFLYIISVAATLFVGLRASLRNGALQGAFLIATAAFAGVAIEGFVIDTDHWRHVFILMGCIWGLADASAPVCDSSRRRDDPETPARYWQLDRSGLALTRRSETAARAPAGQVAS